MIQARVCFMHALFFSIAQVILCNRAPAPEPDTAQRTNVVRVKVAPVVRDSIALPLFIPGKLATAAEMKLGFKTGGIIRDIDAVEGANIRRGVRIAMLDTAELSAYRNKAQTALEKATRDLARVQRLFDDSVATLEQLQNARSAFRAAQSDSAIASFNLTQAVLKAPTAGKILRRLVERNEVVGPGIPVVIFASTEGNWIVNASIPDRDLRIVSNGDRADVSFDAIPGEEFSATLQQIAGAAHPVTGTFEIELALDEIHPGFRPGMIADVRLFPSGQRKFDFIPASALVEALGNAGTVFAVDKNDSLRPVRITIARLHGNLLAVSRGLEGVEAVVGAGAPYVRNAAETIVLERN
ncbi:MAG: efflux RND transporter periplasmic adaptor subunit [Chitinispirillaceae bacterium]|nr:efflux RND transporter periplasmic adaptor subunit [Chitinispirillaceae bacterium]